MGHIALKPSKAKNIKKKPKKGKGYIVVGPFWCSGGLRHTIYLKCVRHVYFWSFVKRSISQGKRQIIRPNWIRKTAGTTSSRKLCGPGDLKQCMFENPPKAKMTQELRNLQNANPKFALENKAPGPQINPSWDASWLMNPKNPGCK